MKSDFKGAAELRTHLRTPWLIAVAVFGVAFLALPFWLEHSVSGRFGRWQAIASSTFTNIGTTLLLASVLFVLERQFVGTVTRTVEVATRRVVHEETRDIREASEALNLRIETLQAEFEKRASYTNASTVAAAHRISDSLSRDSLLSGFQAAVQTGALWGGTLTVPAMSPQSSDDPIRVSFGFALDGPSSEISLLYRRPPGLLGRIAQVDWAVGQSAPDVLEGLRQAMIQAGYGGQARLLDAVRIFEGVSHALEAAIAGRQADDGSWVVGQLVELVSDDLAITDEGVCARPEGLVLRASAFPIANPGVLAQMSNMPETFVRPAPPIDIADSDWVLACSLGQRLFGSRPFRRGI